MRTEMTMHKLKFPSRQRGAVLLVAMIFLVLLTVLALTASSTSIMQERMTGGLRNRQMALMGVETALRGGEEMLWNLSFNNFQNPLPPCLDSEAETDCVYTTLPNGHLRTKVQAFRTSSTWLDESSDGATAYARSLTTLSGTGLTAQLAAQPRFMVEYIGPDLPRSGGITGGAVAQATGGTSGGGAATRHFYRVTARSQGGTDSVIRVAESVYSALNLTNAGFNPGDVP